MTATIYYSYMRFSSKSQNKSGASSARQLRDTRAYADDNQGILDDTMRDEGVSAFRTGKNNTSEGTAFGSFLRKVKEGTIARGSVLCVERLDRISRQQTRIALANFLAIINEGIAIATVSDYAATKQAKRYDENNCNEMDLFAAIMEMKTANEESEKRTSRILDGKKEQRRKIENSQDGGGRIPSWVVRTATGFILDEVKTSVVRSIVASYLDGMSVRDIAKDLNSKNVPTFGYAPRWANSSVYNVLSSRRMLGEFASDKGLVKDNYYPAVITSEQFRKLQSALHSRKKVSARKTSGKPTSQFNLFQGLLRDSQGDSHYVKQGGGPIFYPFLVCERGEHTDSKSPHFPYIPLEGALLQSLEEIDSTSLDSNGKQHDRQKLEALKAELAETEKRIAQAIETAGKSKNFAVLLKMVERLEESKVELAGEIATLEHKLSGAEKQDIAATKSILHKLKATSVAELPALRLKLRSLIVGLIENITIDVSADKGQKPKPHSRDLREQAGKPKTRAAFCRIQYKSGQVRGLTVVVAYRKNTGFQKLDAIIQWGKHKNHAQAIAGGQKPLSNDECLTAFKLAASVNQLVCVNPKSLGR